MRRDIVLAFTMAGVITLVLVGAARHWLRPVEESNGVTRLPKEGDTDTRALAEGSGDGRLPPPAAPSAASTEIAQPRQPAGWLTYRSPRQGFELSLPEDGRISDTSNGIRVDLPVEGGTALQAKYLEATMVEGLPSGPCRNHTYAGIGGEATLMINRRQFLKEDGIDYTMGHQYDIVSYSTLHAGKCFSIALVLRSVKPGLVEGDSLPVFDRDREIEILNSVASTLNFQ